MSLLSDKRQSSTGKFNMRKSILGGEEMPLNVFSQLSRRLQTVHAAKAGWRSLGAGRSRATRSGLELARSKSIHVRPEENDDAEEKEKEKKKKGKGCCRSAQAETQNKDKPQGELNSTRAPASFGLAELRSEDLHSATPSDETEDEVEMAPMDRNVVSVAKSKTTTRMEPLLEADESSGLEDVNDDSLADKDTDIATEYGPLPTWRREKGVEDDLKEASDGFKLLNPIGPTVVRATGSDDDGGSPFTFVRSSTDIASLSRAHTLPKSSRSNPNQILCSYRRYNTTGSISQDAEPPDLSEISRQATATFSALRQQRKPPDASDDTAPTNI